MEYRRNPIIVEFPATDHPKIPEGLKVTCLKGPDVKVSSPNCPVVAWNENIYWPYSYIDNRVGMCIVAYDQKGILIKKWDMPGARYVYKITVDKQKQTVTFWGQANQTIVMTWEELFIVSAPSAGKIPVGVHPQIPEGSKLDPSIGPDKWEPNPFCPIIEWGGFTYWPFSYIDNRVAMNIVAYDKHGVMVKEWEKPGARYVYKITVDKQKQTVTFWGQANQTIVMTWEELLINNAHYYGFDEKDGNKAIDSFDGTDGTISPTAKRISPGHNSSGAIHIDGTNSSCVSFAGELGQFGTSDFFVGFWFNTKETIRYFDLVGNRTAPSHGNFFCVRMTGKHETAPEGRVCAEVDQDGNGTNYIAVEGNKHTGLNDGKWHHVAVVRMGNFLKLYIDGGLAGESMGRGTANIKNGNEFKIGRSLAMDVERFSPNALFDSLYICNYAFSDKEVHDVYNQKAFELQNQKTETVI